MEVNFRNRTLERCYKDIRESTRRWGSPTGDKYIQRITVIQQAKDFNELFTLSFLRLHPLSGNRKGDYSMTVHGRWRLIIQHDEARDVVIIKEMSNHYE